MPRYNHVELCGNLADDPHFELLRETPYIRFDLVVERDRSQMPMGGKTPASPRNDLIRVVEYGIRAELDYYYLRKGAQVTVGGWLESRQFRDTRNGVDPDKAPRRRILEVNAQRITFGRGCDLERGDAHRRSKIEDARAGGNVVPSDLSDEDLEAILAFGHP